MKEACERVQKSNEKSFMNDRVKNHPWKMIFKISTLMHTITWTHALVIFTCCIPGVNSLISQLKTLNSCSGVKSCFKSAWLRGSEKKKPRITA